MHTIEDAYRFSSELYWIAFLLTGYKELSLRVTVDALGSEVGFGCMSSPKCSLIRSAVIQDALAGIQVELATSAIRFAAKQSDLDPMTATDRLVDPTISQAQLEQAFLAIELFPRCALLLMLFEGLRLEEAETLLHSDRNLIKAGQVSGLIDLTRNFGSVAATKLGRQEFRALAASAMSWS